MFFKIPKKFKNHIWVIWRVKIIKKVGTGNMILKCKYSCTINNHKNDHAHESELVKSYKHFHFLRVTFDIIMFADLTFLSSIYLWLIRFKSKYLWCNLLAAMPFSSLIGLRYHRDLSLNFQFFSHTFQGFFNIF